MGYIDTKVKDMYNYLPKLTKKDDFDAFWERTIKKAREVPLNPEKKLINYPCKNVKVYAVSYNGMDDTKINGWFIVPEFMKKEKYPCLIHYHGFSGNMGQPSEFMQWVILGFAVLTIDCRGQGGITSDNAHYTGGFSTNVASRGLLNKEEYYFKAVYMDSVKAIDFACAQPEVDRDKIIIEGGSQGGALGMAVCSLDDRPYLAMVDVPSNSNLERRVEGRNGSFASVADYLRLHPENTDIAFDTLSYFDTMNMADKIKCKVLASVGLKDDTCPAIMYFASYNRIKSQKEIVVYPFNGHEGGGAKQTEVKYEFLKKNIPEWFK